jgi:signal transduction histidine kinase
MPGMNGFEVCRRIKLDEDHSNIPVVLITALADREYRILGIEAGAEDFISKPFDATEVLARIKMLLHVKELHDRLIQDAKMAHETRQQFLNIMPHELRTPMNGVLGMSQLLEMTELTEEQQEYLKDLNQSGEDMLSLVGNFLDFTSIEAGRTQVKSVEFNLRDCVNDTVIMQKIITNAKGLALDVEFIGEFPDVLMGDALRLQQILLNLVGNAIKFTAHGGIAITVKLDEQKNNRVNVKIAVRDTGIGISPEALGKIFLPYIQEDASATRQYDGAGLGLTLSRRLAELMGGTISVESTKNVGSCFTLTVPFAGVQDNSPGWLESREQP